MPMTFRIPGRDYSESPGDHDRKIARAAMESALDECWAVVAYTTWDDAHGITLREEMLGRIAAIRAAMEGL